MPPGEWNGPEEACHEKALGRDLNGRPRELPRDRGPGRVARGHRPARRRAADQDPRDPLRDALRRESRTTAEAARVEEERKAAEAKAKEATLPIPAAELLSAKLERSQADEARLDRMRKEAEN